MNPYRLKKISSQVVDEYFVCPLVVVHVANQEILEASKREHFACFCGFFGDEQFILGSGVGNPK